MEKIPLAKEELIAYRGRPVPGSSDRQLAGNAQRAASGFPGDQRTKMSRMVLITDEAAHP